MGKMTNNLPRTLFFLSKVLLLVAICDAESRVLSTPVKSNSKTVKKNLALQLRGGASPMNADAASKILSSLSLLQGVIGSLAPTKTLEISLASQEPGPLTKALQEDMSGMLCAVAVASHAALFHGLNSKTCLGLAGIPLVLTFSKWILNQDPPKFGMPMKNADALCDVGVSLVYAGLLNPDWVYSTLVLKFLSYFFMIHGIVGMILPDWWGAAFGIRDMARKNDIVMHRMLAAAIEGFGLLMRGFLDDQFPVTTALSLGIAPVLINLLAVVFVWDEAGDIGLRPQWTTVYCLLLGSLLGMIVLQ